MIVNCNCKRISEVSREKLTMRILDFGRGLRGYWKYGSGTIEKFQKFYKIQ